MMKLFVASSPTFESGSLLKSLGESYELLIESKHLVCMNKCLGYGFMNALIFNGICQEAHTHNS